MNSLHTAIRCLAAFGAAFGFLAVAASAADTKPSRVVVVVKSSDEFLADLEHMVVDLAGKKAEWNANVFDNIDIFLIGVDKSRPVRYDQIIGADGGRREQLMAPIADLNEFLKDNLDPIDIIAKKDKKDKNLYILDPEGVYPGWLRYAHDYAFFAVEDHPEDVPADIAPPSATHEALLEKGYDLAARLDNSTTTPADRTAAFATFRDNMLAGIEKRPDETNEAFTLRKTSSEQTTETMERLFVDASDMVIGWITDAKKSEGRGEMRVDAVADSELAKLINLQATAPSQFQSVPVAENAIVSGRMNITLNDMFKEHFRKIYELSKPVTAQRIDGDEKLTDDQKAARKEMSVLTNDLFAAGLEKGVWEGFVSITPSADKTNTGVLAMRVADGAMVLPILDLLPRTAEGYAVEKSVDKAGDVDLHKVTLGGDFPKAIAAFFGDNTLYVGTGKEAVWVAIGPDAVANLKAAVEAAGTAATEASPTVVSLDVKLSPIMSLMAQLRKDGDFDLMKTLQGTQPEAKPSEENTEEKTTAQMLEDFEWRETAVKSLAGEDDRMSMQLDKVEDHMEGKAHAAEGILKAVGDLIAKFAKENLG